MFPGDGAWELFFVERVNEFERRTIVS